MPSSSIKLAWKCVECSLYGEVEVPKSRAAISELIQIVYGAHAKLHKLGGAYKLERECYVLTHPESRMMFFNLAEYNGHARCWGNGPQVAFELHPKIRKAGANRVLLVGLWPETEGFLDSQLPVATRVETVGSAPAVEREGEGWSGLPDSFDYAATEATAVVIPSLDQPAKPDRAPKCCLETLETAGYGVLSNGELITHPNHCPPDGTKVVCSECARPWIHTHDDDGGHSWDSK